MAGRIANGIELSKQSWNGLMDNRFMLLFPLIGGVGAILMSVVVLVPGGLALYATKAFDTGGENLSLTSIIVGVIVLFIYYFAVAFVTLWANTALIASALKVVRGEPSSFGAGISVANRRLGKIAAFAGITATIGTISSMIRSSEGAGGAAKIGASLLGGAWNVISFFALPIMVAEDISLKDVFKESVDLFKKTWGEGFTGSLAVNAISGAIMIGLVVVFIGAIALGVYVKQFIVPVVGLGVVVIAGIGVALIQGAVNGVLKASLYEFAKTGNAGRYIDSGLAAKAYKAG